MSIQIENNIEEGYLRIEANSISYEYRMITGNNIPVFLSCKNMFENNRNMYMYDTSHKMSLPDLAAIRPLGYLELCLLISSIKLCQDYMEKYLLSKNGLIMNPEYIYYDKRKRLLRFVFCPENDKDIFASFNMLAEFLLLSIDYEDEEAVKLAYEIYAQILNKDYELDKLIPEDDLYKEDIRDTFTDGQKTVSNGDVVQDIENSVYKEKKEITVKSAVENEWENNTHNGYDSMQHDRVIHDKSRLNMFSVICITLLITVFTIAGTAYYLYGSRIFRYFHNARITACSSVIISLLIYFPFMNILDIRRRKRRFKNKRL